MYDPLDQKMLMTNRLALLPACQYRFIKSKIIAYMVLCNIPLFLSKFCALSVAKTLLPPRGRGVIRENGVQGPVVQSLIKLILGKHEL